MNATNTKTEFSKFTVGYIPFYTKVAIDIAHYDESGKHIKYHTPTGIYDIELIHFFEEIRDIILEKGITNSGICYEVSNSPRAYKSWYSIVLKVMNSYMPHKDTGYFWWPCWNDPVSWPCEMEQAFYDRVAFLNRIIEDLMCGV